MACGHCHGSSCSNANAFVEDEDYSDSGEDQNQMNHDQCIDKFLQLFVIIPTDQFFTTLTFDFFV